MSTSTHRVEVVPVELSSHFNADSLSVAKVWGYTCCVKTADWQGINKAFWVPPDTCVPVGRPEFSFLADQAKQDGFARIKAKKLRGVVSYGVLVPAPDDAIVGEDWAERLGCVHYEPPLEHEKGGKAKFFTGGEVAPGPNVTAYKYDLDAFQRYHHLFEEGERIFLSEKADGCNARFLWSGGTMHCGSRTEWKKEYPSFEHVTIDGLLSKGLERERAVEIVDRLHNSTKRKNLWWETLERTPWLEKFCRDHPDVVVYGEIAGSVNCIKYGFPEGNRFMAFDLLVDGSWMDAQQARAWTDDYEDFEWVPCLGADGQSTGNGRQLVTIPYNFDLIKDLADGPSRIHGAKQGTIREGVVLKPVKERYDDRLGRVCMKCVSAVFLEKYR